MKKISFEPGTMLNPVPVVLVTSKSRKGENNVFTVAWTGILCSTPPLLYIGVRPERLSYAYIADTKEFTINLPTKDLVKAVDYCGVKSGRTTDKIKDCGFILKKGLKVKSESISQCPVNIECKVKEIYKTGGSHDVFISEIVGVSVDGSLMDKDKKFHLDWAEPIAYSHGEYFPLNKKRIGSFGFSVSKKKRVSPVVKAKAEPLAENKAKPKAKSGEKPKERLGEKKTNRPGRSSKGAPKREFKGKSGKKA